MLERRNALEFQAGSINGLLLFVAHHPPWTSASIVAKDPETDQWLYAEHTACQPLYFYQISTLTVCLFARSRSAMMTPHHPSDLKFKLRNRVCIMYSSLLVSTKNTWDTLNFPNHLDLQRGNQPDSSRNVGWEICQWCIACIATGLSSTNCLPCNAADTVRHKPYPTPRRISGVKFLLLLPCLLCFRRRCKFLVFMWGAAQPHARSFTKVQYDTGTMTCHCTNQSQDLMVNHLLNVDHSKIDTNSAINQTQIFELDLRQSVCIYQPLNTGHVSHDLKALEVIYPSMSL